MARLFIDGFENGLMAWDVVGDYMVYQTSLKKAPDSGDYSCFCGYSSGAQYVQKNFANKTTIYFAYKQYYEGFGSSPCFFQVGNADGYQVSLTYYGGNIFFRRGGRSGTQVGTSCSPWTTNTWHLIEIKLVIDDSVGSVDLKVDGISLISSSGLDTKYQSSAGVTWVRIGAPDMGGSDYLYNQHIDDVVIDDAGWIGDTRIVAVRPNAAGDSNQWNVAKASYENTVTDWNGNLGYVGGQNVRVVIPASALSTSGSSVRLILFGNRTSGQNHYLAGCTIGPRDGSTSSFASTPKRVTFDGANACYIPSFGSIASDWIDFAVDEASDYLVHFFFTGTATFYMSTGAGASYYKTGTGSTDNTETLTLSGYTTDTWMRVLGMLLVQASGDSNNYQNVDDVWNAGDHLRVNTVDQIDMYAASDLGAIVGTIKSLQLMAVGSRNQASTPTQLQVGCRISGTNYFSSSLAMPSYSRRAITQLMEVSPATAGAWTKSEIEGMEIGVKSIA